MKSFLPAFLFILFFSSNVFAQTQSKYVVHFRDMPVQFEENVSAFDYGIFSANHPPVDGMRFAIFQFFNTPGEHSRKQLVNAGVQLLSYLPDNAYTVAVSQPISKELLRTAGVRSISKIPTEIKLDKALRGDNLPQYAIKQPGTIDVLVSITRAIPVSNAIARLQVARFEIIDTRLSAYNIITIRVPQSNLRSLAEVAFIEFIQPLPPADKRLNDEVRSNARANVLNAPIALGGQNLTGKGVVIGVGDNADITSHVDLQDRVINRAAFLYQNHGTQTAGTAAGAGINEAIYQGVAPGATILSQLFGGILTNAPAYVADYGMAVTNNSFGSITGDCEYAGVYDLYSKFLDEQSLSLPGLLHVFAAGNDGTMQCPGYPQGYHTALGGYQSSKNILAVGWGEKNAVASNNGSHGPTMDGRIKPEITTTGSEVRSPGANNSYVTDWGSSMASPAVAGGAALLVEKFRQLHAGANPPSGLLKALLMNGSNDIDNVGPDFKSGFGWMNLNRSLTMLKENHYVTGSIGQGSTVNHSIVVPAGTSQLKVMIYWHDPASAVFSASTLVNDVDLEVLDQAGSTFLPWVLDTTRSNITALATRGADHINNVEQVTIDNPSAGNYSIRVKGSAINVNPTQEYFIVYDFLPATIDLTFPSAGEPLVPGETVTVNWDAWDNSPNPFTLEYSIDNGANWINISTSIPANAKQYNWVVPPVATSQAKVRLKRNGTSLADESMPFVIAAKATLSLGTTQCEGYFALNWTAVPGATDYELMMKQGPQMVPVATTTSTSYIFTGLNKDSTYWVTVRPRINAQPGRRSDAARVQPNSGTCIGTISDNDLKLDSIISPVSGRKQTSTEITSNNISVRIKNLDDAPVNSFQVQYSINGGAFITQNVTATIPALGTYTHTFTGLDFSAANNYTITAVVKNSTNDPVPVNDTLTSLIKQLPNDPISLPFVEDFETAPVAEVVGRSTGLPGLPRWDLQTTTPYGRARTFVNSGIALNGNRAITLDVNRFVQAGNTNNLIGTFNLQNYANTPPAELGLTLDFWYKHHGQTASNANRVWVRSSDTSPWVEVYNLDSAQGRAGVWKKAGPIHIQGIAGANQLSSSYQVRIGQRGVISMGDDHYNAGITVDNLRLFSNPQDFSLIKIDTPIIRSCGLSQNVPLRVSVVNYGAISTSVPIRYSVDGGPVVSETLPAGVSTYTFAQAMDLSQPGDHTVTVWVDHSPDTDKSNDTARIVVKNQPVISTFPYLETFESGPGNWYAEGHNSSWQYGTPTSIKINKAASGTGAWKTSLQGSYNDDEESYLYSPCFNIAGLTTPWLSLSLAIDIEQCGENPCDKAWIEYSTDGTTWRKLGGYGQGLNWYNHQRDNVWDSAGFKRWHSAGVALPVGASDLRLRVVMSSDPSLIKEGVAIDDIHIYDRSFEIYTRPSIPSPVTQTIAGNNWQHFTQGNKVIASLNANGNNLASTAVQVYINKGGFNAVRDINGQYFHDRSLTIKPGNLNNSDSTSVRFYFTDAETDTLVRSTNCPGCSKPVDAYGLGVTKYKDIDPAKENGDLFDNVEGVYSFINAAKVAKVPYDIGYYAEFKVKDFSEFWLNNGGPNGDLPLPVLLTSFNANKQNKDVLIQWSTANEVNVDRYEIQVARGNDDYRRQQFTLLETVSAKNAVQNNYRHIDNEAQKAGARYYRLKIIDKNGQVRYSGVKVVVFENKSEWTVYPNPVKDVLQVIVQANAGEKMDIQVMNATGQVVLTKTISTTGFQDKVQIDMQRARLAAGLYVIKIMGVTEVKQFKVIKQ